MKTTTWLRGRPLGRGSFGSVSLAFRSPSGEAFAVKSVGLSSCSPDSVRSLENEIVILSSLSSPYVVEYLGDDETREPGLGPCRNLHVEYMPGGTAADLVASGKGEAEVRGCARCVVHALAYLHGVAGVVHCDVKGRNVLLGRSPGVAKLADFGAALRMSDAGADQGNKNWFRGTPLWMAPEVVRGQRPTPASDIWSLGCTVIEMATGARPWPRFGPGDAAAAMFEIGYGKELPEFPAGLSKAGWDFLDKCLRRDAEERWTAEQLLQHPFLAEDSFVAAAAEKSPRCVLDFANSEFCDDGAGESCSTSYRHASGSCASERVKELASEDEAILGWDSDGWDVVRCAEELNLVTNQEQNQQPQQYPSRCNGEQRDLVADGILLSIATGCSASSLRHCCCNSGSHFFCFNKQEGLMLLPPEPINLLLELPDLFLILPPLYFNSEFSGTVVGFNTVSFMLLCSVTSVYFDALQLAHFFLQLSKNRVREEETCEDKLEKCTTCDRPSNPRTE